MGSSSNTIMMNQTPASSPRWSLASSLKVGMPTPYEMRLQVQEDYRKIAKKRKGNPTFSIIAKGTFVLGVVAMILVLFLALFRDQLAQHLLEDESSDSWASAAVSVEVLD